MNLEITLHDLFILVPPLMLLEGFFSGSEIALLSADQLTLQSKAKKGDKLAEFALFLIAHPERIFSTTLLMTSVAVISVSALIALYFFTASSDHRFSEIYAIAITSPLVVVFGELIPKTFFQRYANRLAPLVAYPIYGVFYIFFPITFVISKYTTRLSKVVGPIDELLTGRRRSTREQLLNLLNYSRDESELKTSEKHMIKRILDFKETEAKNALIPLVRVDSINEQTPVREALESFAEHRHSRMPVYKDRMSNIVGILESRDLFESTDLDQPIIRYMQNAKYVSVTQSVEDLMIDMNTEDFDMAVVVDEYGGAVGIITFEDIVEEIVGTIEDEDDPKKFPIKAIGEQRWIIQAQTEIVQINEQLKIDIPEGEEYSTLSGFLLQQFGRIPIRRDELFYSDLKFTIHNATLRQIESVIVEVNAKDPSNK